MVEFEAPIERSKIREFARATQSASPAYDGPDAVVPPTFLSTLSNFWQPPDAMPALDFDVRRVLHAGEEFVFHDALPRAGQALRVTVRIGDVEEKTGKRGGTMRFATVVREFHDSAGTLVAEQRTTLVETSRPPAEGEA